MESSRQEKKKQALTEEQLAAQSDEINAGSEDFLNEKKPVIEDDLQLERIAPVKTLSQVVKQTVLSNEKSVMDILTAAENADEKNGFAIKDAEYWQPDEGELITVIVTGLITTNIDKKDVRCVSFMNKKSEQFISGATTLVKTFEKIEGELPGVFKILCKGKTNGENGKYFIFDVSRL